MLSDVFCPKCNSYLGKVNPSSSGYKVKVFICPHCAKGVQVTFGNGRIEIK